MPFFTWRERGKGNLPCGYSRFPLGEIDNKRLLPVGASGREDMYTITPTPSSHLTQATHVQGNIRCTAQAHAELLDGAYLSRLCVCVCVCV